MLHYRGKGETRADKLLYSNLVRRLQAFASGPDAQPGPDSLERKFSAPFRRRY